MVIIMAFDGIVLNKVTTLLNERVVGGKINKIYQISNSEILFQVRSNHETLQLLVSCHPTYARIGLTYLDYPRPDLPSSFTMFLRKHLEGAYIKEITQISYERILKIVFATRNAFGDQIELHGFIEIMGRHSNFILTDSNGKILDSLKRISASVSSVRIIYPGITYEYPPLQSDKKNIFADDVIISNDMHKYYLGLSPQISQEMSIRKDNGTKPQDIIKMLKDSYSLFLYKEPKEMFSLLPLSSLASNYKQYDIFEGLDAFYGIKDETDRIKQQTSNLVAYVDGELKKNKLKLEKLKVSLFESENSEEYKVKGELLYTVLHTIDKGMNEVIVDNYYDNTKMVIALDPRLSGKDNAKKYYQKYSKAKNGISIIKEQILLTEKEIEYFDLLATQLSYATYHDAIEIREELETAGYIRKKEIKKIKQNRKPNYDVYESHDGFEILVGKNNLQNDYLTFKVASYNHLWFHAKGVPGSHVIIKSDNPSDEAIRSAAMLAAFYSKARNSSSVPIDYTQVRNIKRLSSGKPGAVTFSTNKTIYIDPDEDYINNLIKK